jgi:hypothetical protein
MPLDAVDPLCADAWVIIGQARAGAAMKPVATERAIVSFLIVFPPLLLDVQIAGSAMDAPHGGPGQHTFG